MKRSDLLIRTQNNGHKMLTEFRRTIHEQNENFNKQKILVPKRNHRGAEYNS